MAFQGFSHQADSYVLDGAYSQGYDGDHGNLSPHVSQQRQLLREQEHKQELANEKAHKASRYVFRTQEDLTINNPSVRDGLDVDKDSVWRRQYCKLIQDAGVAMKIPQWGIAVGITLCHRFFAVKSMKKNDRFLIATACLFLAAKIEESPRQIKMVIMEVERVRHAKNPAALRALDDPAHMERVKEEVLQAERAVLYTLGFDLRISHPYETLLDWLNRERLLTDLATDSPYKALVQNSWNLVNDSLRTTLCLQFPAPKIAVAALWMADLLNVDGGIHYTKLPRGAAFYEKYDIKPEELASICGQMLSEYEHSKLSRMSTTTGQPLATIKAEVEAKRQQAHQLGAMGARVLGMGSLGSVKAEEEEGEVKD